MVATCAAALEWTRDYTRNRKAFGTPVADFQNTRFRLAEIKTEVEIAQVFVEHGAQVAYNLDGGGSTTMVLGDALVNNPLGKGQERGTSDIIYIAG